jgi:DNA-binding NarL/FixJ family response regulator
MSAGIGVLVADNDALARRVVCSELERSEYVSFVAEAGDQAEAIDVARHPEITLVVLEPRITEGQIERHVRQLRDREGPPDVLIFSADIGADAALDAIRAGACGVVSKAEGVGALLSAFDRVADGDLVLPGTLVMALIELVRVAPEAGVGMRPVVSQLTEREWEIIDLMSAGASTQAIADELVLSVHTVYSHIKNIMRKLGVHARDEAVRAACAERDTAGTEAA